MIVRRNCFAGSFFTAIFAILAFASVAGATPPVLQSAVSRLTHTGVGAMDVQLPLSGGSGVECRLVSGGMKIVLYFDQPVVSGSAAVSAGATVGTPTFSGNNMIVPLSSVANASSLTVTVTNVKNGGGETLTTAAVPLRVLQGDINGDGNITASDTNICRAAVASSFPVNGANFRCDINLDGSLTGSDTNLIRAAAVAGATAQPGTVTNDTAPTITDVANQTAYIGQTSSPASFSVTGTVADPSTLGVVASSSDQTIVPNSGIVITGTGTSRSLTITPVSTLTTSSTITITMYSSDGLLTSTPVSFTVYVTPPPTIFLATLAPIPGAVSSPPGITSLGTGSAVLTVAGDLSHANLVYSFSNLAGTDSDDAIYGPGAAVLLDIPTLATAKNVQPDGSILWTFKATSQLSIAQQIAMIFNNTAYMTIESSAFPSGELTGVFQKIVGSQTFTPPAAPPTITIDPPTPADASRFLQQAGFGGTAAEITALSNASDPNAGTALEHWIALQEASALPIAPNYGAVCQHNTVNGVFGTNPNYPATLSPSSLYNSYVTRTTTPRSAPNPNAPYGDPFGSDDLINEIWWGNTVNATDELRQRVATAYMELFVVSQLDNETDYNQPGLCTYYDMLADDAFVNFRQLLGDVTLHPIMGDYLSMMGNDYFNYQQGTFAPNENYAREIMQLFTIGLYMLQPDGTLMLNSSGQPIPTYTQPTITQFAGVYTGWDADDGPVSDVNTGGSSVTYNYLTPSGTQQLTFDWQSPMAQTTYYGPAVAHYPFAKSLLNYPGAATFPGAGQPAYLPQNMSTSVSSATAELNFALDNIFNHPNVGPFICRQLIQRLVTSNPSPAYVYRVAQKFANDGTGVRGNMGAVIKAILTDYEARSPVVRTEPGFGKVREPIIRTAQMLHSLQAKSHTGRWYFEPTDITFGQTMFRSLTVFNFFTPTYQQPGAIQKAGLVSPEMNIIYEATIANAQDLIFRGIYGDIGAGQTNGYSSAGAPLFTGTGFQGDGGTNGGTGDIFADFSTNGCGLVNLATTSGVPAMVDQVGLMLMGVEPPGSAYPNDPVMDPTMRTTIINYINNNVSASNHLAQVQAAVHLVATSSQATVQN